MKVTWKPAKEDKKNNVVWFVRVDYNVSKEHTASFFTSQDEGSMFLENVGIYFVKPLRATKPSLVITDLNQL
jgi:hypothetical protein